MRASEAPRRRLTVEVGGAASWHVANPGALRGPAVFRPTPAYGTAIVRGAVAVLAPHGFSATTLNV